jgi:cardiolipin synthase
MGHAVGAVLTERRVLGPVEWRLMSAVGLALCALSVLVVVFPRVLAYPAAALGLWGGLALLWSAIRLRRSLRPTLPRDEMPAAPAAPSPKEGEG